MRQQRIEEEAVADAAEREYQVIALCCAGTLYTKKACDDSVAITVRCVAVELTQDTILQCPH